VGARPQIIKLAPVVKAFRDAGLDYRILHTGQHYDPAMSDVHFRSLRIEEPHYSLGVGSDTHARQTGLMMEGIEGVLEDLRPACVLVYGDTNSTLAGALSASKLKIPVGHVESCVRSFDRTMPEEVNRVLTDQLSDLLLITSPEARDNLLAEGLPADAVVMTGNTMIDTLLRLLPETDGIEVPEKPYGLVTLHRPGNVDHGERLSEILSALGRLDMPLVFPAHPRTLRSISECGLAGAVPENLRMLAPFSYLEFVAHERSASVVITDSGGVQEETSVLGVPCVTVRPNTERPITCLLGTNVLCPDPRGIPDAVEERLSRARVGPVEIPFWDGKAGVRAVEAVSEFMRRGGKR